MIEIKTNYDIKFGYKFGVYSPSEPNPNPLGYCTIEEAEQAKSCINLCLNEFDNDDTIWNTTHWKTKPESYEVCKLKYE